MILHEQTLHRLEYGMQNGLEASAQQQTHSTTHINAMAMDQLGLLNLAKNHPFW